MNALIRKSDSVWCVWTEWGEYEQFSRDLRACFTTPELAELHAAQLRENDGYDVVEVVCEPVLAEVPVNVPFIEWSAHIDPDGAEDHDYGYSRGEKFRTWSNEIEAATGRMAKWRGERSPDPDLYIEVIGCDKEAVAAEYKRLLAEARERLGKS